MRFGINTFLFTSPFTNESTKLFKTFKKWGFETVEIPVEDQSHIDQMDVLNCPSLIGPVYSVVGKADAVEPAQQKLEWALVVQNVKQLAQYAEARGKQICI